MHLMTQMRLKKPVSSEITLNRKQLDTHIKLTLTLQQNQNFITNLQPVHSLTH